MNKTFDFCDRENRLRFDLTDLSLSLSDTFNYFHLSEKTTHKQQMKNLFLSLLKDFYTFVAKNLFSFEPFVLLQKIPFI